VIVCSSVGILHTSTHTLPPRCAYLAARGFTPLMISRSHLASSLPVNLPRAHQAIFDDRHRPAPRGTESFVTVGVRTYDGNGGFHTVSDDHGSVVQSSSGIEATGSYTVNANCSGKTEITIATPGGPVTLESSFVIVDSGKQVKEASMSPPAAIATAVLTRIE
jgi:hypothetical protein